jgi:hypothetical protein
VLTEAEAELLARGWRRGSLAPGRAAASPLPVVWATALAPEDGRAVRLALARGLADIATAQARSFPDNLFADHEYMAASLVRRARAAEDPAAALAESCEQVAGLQRLFGQDTQIRFRYTHDFAYGYDWAKWVAREPESRAGVQPFDPEFLAHMQQRAHELLGLIRVDDSEYPSLPAGQDRNPFPFSREPADEAALHQALADRGELPLAAWDPDATPLWDRPYAALRLAQAERMGLLRG